jgi:hypothetical protein
MPNPIDDPRRVEEVLEEDNELDGQTIDLDDDSDVEPTEGGALVSLNPGAQRAVDEQHADWFSNLAEDLEPGVLEALAADLLDKIVEDKEARQKRDEQYAEGIRRTGMGDDAPGGAQFAGATRVVHPMLAEAAVDFSSRAMKELFPAGGPVKDYIPGTPTKAKVEKAQRKTKHMNYQLTVQCRELRTDLEQLMTQVPLGGAQYLHVDWDERRRIPKFTPIYIDEMLLPFAASNYYGAERRTHWQHVTQSEFDARVRSGLYVDSDLIKASSSPDESAAASANDKIEGREESSTNPDNERSIYKVSLKDYLIEGDDAAGEQAAPYIVHIDDQTRNVLGVYRNWMEDDKTMGEMIDTVEFPFIPWRGAYPIGLTHLIGGLSAAATGALRAVLDSALINNFPGALKLKGSTTGQSTSINATQLTEIEGSIVQDDIRKLIMPLPFNPPSPVLFQLLGFLVDTGKGVVQTSFDKLSDQPANLPVGTTVALIDQGLTVYSAIHARLHSSMARLLEIIHRLNGLYLDEDELKDDVGEILAYRRDYEGPVDVVPVSDPAVSSEVQRFAKVQAVVQRADTHPQVYNALEVENMWLEQLKIPDFERLLIKAADPKPMNAVNENLASVGGTPPVAFPEQDHLAHLQVHLDFLMKLVMPMGTTLAASMAPLLGHVKEHVAMWYVAEVYKQMSATAGRPAEELMDDDPDVSRMYDRTLALVSTNVLDGAMQVFQQLPQVVQSVTELMQKLQPPMPQDPAIAAAQAAGAETQRKTAADQAKAQADQGRMQTEQAKIAATSQTKAAELALKREQLQSELQQAQQSNDTYQQIELQKRMAELEKQRQNNEAEDARAAAEMQTDAAKLGLDMQDSAADRQSREALAAADIQARIDMNNSDNDTAKLLAAAELATDEKTAMSTGTGINPNP